MMRPLVDSDWNDLAWIESVSAPGFRWTLQGLRELARDHQFWVWEGAGRPRAFVAGRSLPGAWEITVLATDPACRGQGDMRRLLSELANAKRQGGEIWLEVHENNDPARRLYEGLNFQVVGRRKGYYHDGGTALVMSLR